MKTLIIVIFAIALSSQVALAGKITVNDPCYTYTDPYGNQITVCK